MIETLKTRLETRMLKEVQGKLEDANMLLSVLYDNACEDYSELNKNKTVTQEAKDKQMSLVDLYSTTVEAIEGAVGHVYDILNCKKN